MMKNNFKKIEIEKEDLKQQLEKSNNIIHDLSKKLKVALNEVEELQNKKFGFFKRFLNIVRIKKLN